MYFLKDLGNNKVVRGEKKKRIQYDIIINDTKNNYLKYLFLNYYKHNKTLLTVLSEVCHEQLSGMAVITKVSVLWSMCLSPQELS